LVGVFYVIVVVFLFQSTVVKQQKQEPTHQNSDVSTMRYKTVTGNMMTDIGNVYMFILLLKQENLANLEQSACGMRTLDISYL